MKINLSQLIIESKERVWDNQTIDVFGVSNKEWLEPSTRRVSDDLSNYKVIKKNYFAYNPYRINVGSIWLFWWNIWAVSPAYVVFKVDENKILPSILLQFLKSTKWLFEINQRTHWWVRKSLSFWELWAIEIDIPNIEIQKKFFENIEQHTNKVEKLSNLNVSNQSLVSKLQQSILQDAIQGKLVPQNANDEPANELLKRIQTEKQQLIKEKKIKKPKNLTPITDEEKPFELPNSWEWVRFWDIAEIKSNLVSPFEFPNMPHIAPNNIEKSTGRLLWYKTVKEDNVISNNHYFYPSQLIYSKVRPKLNKVVKINFEGLCSADMYPIESYIDIDFLQKWMLSYFFLKEVDKFDNRIKMPKINQKELNSIPFPIPPIEEQKRIVAKVDELMNSCEVLGKEVNETKENGERLMESVLGEVFR